MIVVDTSVWVDHLRRRNAALIGVLGAGLVLCHPFVIGELACGHLRQRSAVLESLAALPAAPLAAQAEVLSLIDRHALAGRGIGWTDAHLLASTALLGHGRLWTHDKRLAAIAAELGLAAVV